MTTVEMYQGRPESEEGRLPREIRTYDFLDRLGIAYRRTDHDRADNMEACNEIDAILGVIICKNLFLCNRQQTAFYLLAMPEDIRRKRLETAHALIRQGYSVLNAGYSSGFSDYSAFYRAFCHLYGQAPSTFSSQTRKTGRRRTATESEE